MPLAEEDEGCIVGGLLAGEGPIAVGKIKQPLQVGKLPLADEVVHIGEDRPEVGPPKAPEGEPRHTALQVLLAGNFYVLLYLCVAQKQMQVDP